MNQPNPSKWRLGVGILTLVYLVVSPVLGTLLLMFSDQGPVEKIRQIPGAFADAANSKGLSIEERRRRSEVQSRHEKRHRLISIIGILCWLSSMPSALIGTAGSFRNKTSADKHIAIAVGLWLASAVAGWLIGGKYSFLFGLVGIPLAVALCLRAARTESAALATPMAE